jgi:hypothetical protein
MVVPDDLSAVIEQWMADGIITAEQADRMRDDLVEPLTVSPGDSPALVSAPVPGPRTSRAALVTEALGYLGGVIILVALGLVVGNLWDQLSAGVRLALVGVVALLLLVAGALIPARLGATGTRLRSVLWLASSTAMAAFLGLGASEWAGWVDESEVTIAAFGTALYSGVLWWAHRHLLQQVAVFVPLLVGVGAGVSLLPDAGALPGLAVWGVSVAWLALAWGGLLPGRQVGTVLGAVGMVGAAATLVDQGWGVILALATVSALISLGLAFRDLFLLGVGAAGTLMVLPPIMGRYFPGALAPALVLLGLGVLLVLAAVLTTRRRGDAVSGAEARWAIGTPSLGISVAAVVVVATSAVVLMAGVR